MCSGPPGYSNTVELAALEAATLSTRGGGWAPLVARSLALGVSTRPGALRGAGPGFGHYRPGGGGDFDGAVAPMEAIMPMG